MAFSVAVIQQQKTLKDCPHLDAETVEQFDGRIEKKQTLEDDQAQVIDQLKEKVSKIDFTTVADKLGANLINGKLAINSLGKDFIIDAFRFLREDYEKSRLLFSYRLKELEPLFNAQELIGQLKQLNKRHDVQRASE